MIIESLNDKHRMDKIKEFGKILLKIDKTKVSSDFWDREKESFKKLDKDNEVLGKALQGNNTGWVND